MQKALGKLNSTIEENISGLKVVKAFRRSDSAIEAFRKDNQETYEAGVYAHTYAFLLMPLTNQLGNLFIIVLAGLGGFLAIRGLVTVGLIAHSLVTAVSSSSPSDSFLKCITPCSRRWQARSAFLRSWILNPIFRIQ